MKNLLLAGLALAFAAAPAHATLQLSITANGSTFTCSDGELSCDESGGANNLLTIDTTVGGAFVELTLTQSTFSPNTLQLSSSNIVNESGAPISISFDATDSGFVPPVEAIKQSASLTFNDAVGSATSQLQFWADGGLLFTATGTPLTNPDSFEGSHTSAFSSLAPFSMAETANLNLIAGGSITGLNESMQSVVPEPKTWVMLAAGFGLMSLLGFKRRSARYAI